MRFLSVVFSAMLFSIPIVSCQPLDKQNQIPNDEATSEERATIEKTMSHLTELFKANGYQGSLDKMPIIVRSEDPYKTGWAGLCDEIGKGTGHYIAITRWAFERDLEDGTKSEVTAVLLHEIGHCYFARDHDHELISSTDYYINVEYSGERGGTQTLVEGIPATIMYLTSGERPYSSIVTSNRELQTYYVRELLGLERIQRFNDLTKFKSVKIAKKSNIGQNDIPH